MRSPSVSRLLWQNGRVCNNPQVDSQGWLKTGDAAELDNVLTIRGRFDFLLQQAGEKIAPEAVESVLREGMPEGAAVYVTSVGTTSRGDDLIALVTAPTGLAETAVARARSNARGLRTPFRVNRFAAVSDTDITVSTLGKVDRAALACRRWIKELP